MVECYFESSWRHKIFRETNISYPLIRTCTCAYQGLRNVSFSENVEPETLLKDPNI